MLPIITEIFENLNEGIYILDKEGNYIYCNKAFIKMTNAPSRETVLALNAFELVPDGYVSKSVAVEAFAQKKKLTIVNTVHNPSGYIYNQMATATPIFDAEGEIEYVLVEMVRLDLLRRRFQQAMLNGDENAVEVASAEEDKAAQKIIAESLVMKKLLALASQVAKVDASILISGETGTGKEVFADYIHNQSHRAKGPMVVINCASLPESLLETELFGYEKGSFTGAKSSGKPGLIEMAKGGTLFLDEINSMPLALQGKLLRVLETHRSKRIGAVKEQDIDFRLLSASNESLKTLVDEGRFRADLYYRLNVVSLEIPPLRERKEDIVPLALFFLEYNCKKYGLTKIFGNDALIQLEQYDWPGNVRELKNLVERLIVSSSMGSIEINKIQEIAFTKDTPEEIVLPEPDIPDWEDFYQIDAENFSLKGYMEKCERKLIEDSLKKWGSTYKVAKELKTDHSTICRKKNKYGL